MTSLKDVQGQSSCSISFSSFFFFSLAFMCNHAFLCNGPSLFFRCNCALSVALRAAHLLRFFEFATQRLACFAFARLLQLKTVYPALCWCHSASRQYRRREKPHHLPCMQPHYMHNSRSRPLSIWMSLGCTVHRANLLSFEPHRLSWPFPCSHTHKPKLSTVSLK